MNLVLTKRSILVLLFFGLGAHALTARAQVVPSAEGRRWTLSVGGEGSAFQPDYEGNGIAQTSVNRLYGIGAYGDMRFSRWVQIEAETRFDRFNQLYFGSPSVGNGENTYQIGPRIPVGTFKGLTPYGKFLFGVGTGDFLSGSTTVMTFGGGVDYRLNRKFTLRAFDFEYQQWDVTPILHPYGGSVGLSYKIF